MPNTLGTLKAEVQEWLEEGSSIPDSRYNAAINDGVESLWSTLMRASISLFMGGPVSLSIDTATQGVILVSVADPTTAPTVTDVVEGSLGSHTAVCAYTLVTESGTETMISGTTSHSTAANNVASVAAPTFTEGAIGWNCYMGSTAARLAKQNDEPILFGVAFQEPATGEIDDPDLPLPPIENTTGDDICYIRHLEAQMPDLGYKAYDAADIGSLLMRRAGRNVATSSEYQNFYWDLINQRQLEFRPTTALAWNPRYFYIKRPRRLAFDNAPLPFLTVPSVAFLRYWALSLLSLSIREFKSADAWEAKAEKERARCELTVVQMNHVKNDYITAFP